MGAAVLGFALPAPALARTCGSSETRSADTSVKALTSSVICLINRERTQRGLGRLAVGKRLWLAAYGHAQDMRDQQYFSHTSLDGRTFVDRIRNARYLEGHEDGPWTISEDIAWAPEQFSQPAAIVQAFMNSPAHRAVLLDGRLVEVGVGYLRGTPRGDRDGATVVVDFGSLVSDGDLHQEPPNPQPAPEPPAQEPAPQQPAGDERGRHGKRGDDRGKDDDERGSGKGRDRGRSRLASPAWGSVTVSAVLVQKS